MTPPKLLLDMVKTAEQILGNAPTRFEHRKLAEMYAVEAYRIIPTNSEGPITNRMTQDHRDLVQLSMMHSLLAISDRSS